MAITKFDQFDFLIDIVPRDEIKQNKPREETTGRPVGNPDQVSNFNYPSGYLNCATFVPLLLFQGHSHNRWSLIFLLPGSLLFTIGSASSTTTAAHQHSNKLKPHYKCYNYSTYTKYHTDCSTAGSNYAGEPIGTGAFFTYKIFITEIILIFPEQFRYCNHHNGCPSDYTKPHITAAVCER